MRKSKKADNDYHKKYYHDKKLKKVQSDRARLNYWRKKYCKYAEITMDEFLWSFRAAWSEERLRSNCIALKESIV